MGEMVHAGQQGARPHPAVRRDAADGDSSEADAVVGALASDEARARALAADAVIADRDLERGVDRLGARIHEEHVIEAGGRDLTDALGKLERTRMSHLKRRCVIERLELMRDRVANLRPAVAGIDAPQARYRIQYLSPIGGVVVHPGCPREDTRLGLELAVRGERHPEGFEGWRVRHGSGSKKGLKGGLNHTRVASSLPLKCPSQWARCTTNRWCSWTSRRRAPRPPPRASSRWGS